MFYVKKLLSAPKEILSKREKWFFADYNLLSLVVEMTTVGTHLIPILLKIVLELYMIQFC